MRMNLCVCLRNMMVLALLSVAVIANAQEMRFVQTGSIDQYGNRQGPSNYGASEIKLVFDGAFIKQQFGTLTLRWRFHHSQGSNNVYYLVATDYLNGNESLTDDNVIVVASDYSALNKIDRQCTLIYERRERNYGTLAR